MISTKSISVKNKKMANDKKPLWQVLKDSKMNPQTYAMIIVDKDDAVYMFSGEGEILLDLVPGLVTRIKEKISMDKLH